MEPRVAVPLGQKHSRFPLDLLKVGDVLECDVSILYQGSYILYRSKGQKWTEDDRQKLIGFGISEVFMPFNSPDERREFLDARMSKTILDQSLPVNHRAKLLYDSSHELVETIFETPLKPEHMQRAVAYVRHTINFLAADRKNFIELLGATATDYNEFAHGIHTAAFAIVLAKRMGYVNPPELTALGLAALLHDIGKSKIDKKVLEKKSPLDEWEKRELRKHVLHGVEIVHKHNKTLPPLVETLILEHHERPDGSGYPHGKKDLSDFSRVLSIVDCFDAMTSERPFRAEIKTVDALRIMMTDLKSKYDSSLLLHLIKALQI